MRTTETVERLDVTPDGRTCFVRRFRAEAAADRDELRRALDAVIAVPPSPGFSRASYEKTEDLYSLSGSASTVDVEQRTAGRPEG